MHKPDAKMPITDLGIARAETEGSFMQCDRLVERANPELAPTKTCQCVRPVAVERKRFLIFRDRLLVSTARAQHLTVGVMRDRAAGRYSQNLAHKHFRTREIVGRCASHAVERALRKGAR